MKVLDTGRCWRGGVGEQWGGNEKKYPVVAGWRDGKEEVGDELGWL
jgi:hypothetical protein